MRVGDLMTRALITRGPHTTVPEARHVMRESRIRHLPVVENDRLIGLVTDRDIRQNMPSPATSLSAWEIEYLLHRLTLEHVMTKAVITVSPERSAYEAARLMLDCRIGALPVVDDGRLVGIVTETDFVRAFVDGLAPSTETTAARSEAAAARAH